MKIAILILAHKKNQQIFELINHLSKDFELYIHIDLKSDLNIQESENVHIFKKYKVYHGSFNQILATLLLFQESKKGYFDRYILISGQDLPIKSNDDIISFFEQQKGIEFFEFNKLPVDCWQMNGGMERLTKYHPNEIDRNEFNCYLLKIINLILYHLRKYLFSLINKVHKRRKIYYELYGGANWINITDKCLNYILLFLIMNPDYIKLFKYSYYADEIFFQTIALKYKEDLRIKNTSLRYVDWGSGPEFPKTLRIEDFDKIMLSDTLFARKFDQDKDKEVIYKILKYITQPKM